MIPVHWIVHPKRPIYDQLVLEEALLRADDRNYVLIQYGSPRCIVMGSSQNPSQLLDLPRVHQNRIPIIQRMSGGGTVIVDEHTLFVSFIFSLTDCQLAPFPEPIMRWCYDLYQKAWAIPGFSLIDNDFTIHHHKCGGNAQYIRKNRFLHHTSFLWDFYDSNMDYLLPPPKQPTYRQGRTHNEFLCRLKDRGQSPEIRIRELHTELVKRFYITDISPSELEIISQRDHRRTTRINPHPQRNHSKPVWSLRDQ